MLINFFKVVDVNLNLEMQQYFIDEINDIVDVELKLDREVLLGLKFVFCGE
jgi:hypothetical protein